MTLKELWDIMCPTCNLRHYSTETKCFFCFAFSHEQSGLRECEFKNCWKVRREEKEK